jgi:shikimate kinase
LNNNSSKKHLILIGLMGSGKSTVGAALHALTRLPLLDSDKAIETAENMPITTLFKKNGEAYFRQLEAGFCETLFNRPPHIISTGGGIILSAYNRHLLKENGTVFWLHAPIEELEKRLKDDASRPLLHQKPLLPTLKTLLENRQPLYQACADYMILTQDLSAEALAKQILQLFSQQRTSL